MKINRFLKQLRKELPDWQEHGWVTRENAKAIIEHVESQSSQVHFLAYSIAVLGVLLLGSGVITYFAANWNEMSKLAKLFILFGSLYAAYAAAGYFIMTDKAPKVGQAFLLLGVILFGANIMLIAQIYHIDEHYPNGVLLWSGGGLLTAYLLRSQPAMNASIVLATLWTSMESFGFEHVHGWFLLVWLTFLPAIYQWHWRKAAHCAMTALLLWSCFTWFSIGHYWRYDSHLYLVQIYFVCYLALFVAGMVLHSYKTLDDYGELIENYAVVGALSSLYVLTFPDLQSGLRGYYDETFRMVADPLWVKITIAALLVLFGLVMWHRQRVYVKERPRYLLYAQLLMAATILLILANLFVSGVHGSWIAITFNFLFFAGVIWLVIAGMQINNRFLINIAFIYFALGLLTRYFDTFWTLLNRSFFFMAGGVILIVGGYLLEQQRRRINEQLLKQRHKKSDHG